MANSISVAVGDIDTIRLGCRSRVSLPAGVSRVTGNAASCPAGAAAPDVEPPCPQPAATRARSNSRGARNLLMHPPLGRRMRCLWESEAQPALPPRTELAATEAGDLAPPPRGGAGPHSCGTAPGSHRTSLVPVAPGGGAGRAEYMTDSGHDRCDKTDARRYSTQGMTPEEATAEFESTATGAPSMTGRWPPAALSGRPRTGRSGRPHPAPPRTAGRSRTVPGASRSSAGSWSSCGTGPLLLPPRLSAGGALLLPRQGGSPTPLSPTVRRCAPRPARIAGPAPPPWRGGWWPGRAGT